ncbi:hypothetical protein SADUNF_Sadunf16G0075200 [Salix dunnii]|uniref:tRNA ligase phosphodiesterase domain-containing protein n=1 Tax=Salix dunnii TaxID=1413687 RepID=A0A835MGA7_9ROSI|nr:hypothetical protein SADUNF_Sadunf16G0075200 [Salix dunnii]
MRQRILCSRIFTLPFYSTDFIPVRAYIPIARFFALPSLSLSHRSTTMPQSERQKRNVEANTDKAASSSSMPSAVAEEVTDRIGGLRIRDENEVQKTVWKPESPQTIANADVENVSETTLKSSASLSRIFKGNLLENFTVDNSTYSLAQIRATFYPKFENEKSDQEIRARMIEVVSKGLGTLEVTLKHSGSLFMYAGHEGGAYAKNSFGNVYTAVGVFVLGRMYHEAWGTAAGKKQVEFNDFLEINRMCISMELVTAVLGDHGQRPREDYVVVTAVTELGNGKPKFYSTPEVIAFCRKWRLPTNHVWLFSTRRSVTSFFAAYDALCEEGLATTVCRALDEVADVTVPGSKDHIKVQGEILEGLVARIVSHESSKHIEEVLKKYPPPPVEGAGLDLGPSLREICAANRSDEKQQIKALLQSVGSSFCPNFSDWFGVESGDSHSKNADRSVVSKFLQAQPSDFSTTKLQEMIRLMKERRLPAAFKCYHNFHKISSVSVDDLFYKMVIHVHSDSAFRRYQKEMRNKPGLWPLYRGFFVDINLFKANKERAAEIAKNNNIVGIVNDRAKDDLADDDANLMIKLKFLTYKLRTFLIRNGLSTLFKDGPSAYKAYYLRMVQKDPYSLPQQFGIEAWQMKIWGTSLGKQQELSKMLDEWAVYIRRKYGNKQLSSSMYLTEAEPFLEQYASRSPENQALIGSAGSFVRAEDFMAIIEGGRDEEGDLEMNKEMVPPSPISSSKETVQKDRGLIVFFPDYVPWVIVVQSYLGIPGCAKSALCKELLNAPGGLGDDRPVLSLMGDLIKGKYWQKIADERRKKPYSVILADKNAPNEEVWRQIEGMCRSTQASAVPVIPDSEGTDSNPFSLDALAVFMFRVLQRVNHPGNLDKGSPNAGYVLLMFYHLYDGKNRAEFESELIERFGSLVKMPLLRSDSSLPDPVRLILEEGINLYRLHTNAHGRLESTKGSYAKEWVQWEKQLREVLIGNAEHLNSIQVPFESAVKQVSEQLQIIINGEYTPPSTEKRKLGLIVFAAVSLPVTEISSLLDKLVENNPKVKSFLEDKDVEPYLKKAHVTLAHKRSHGVTAVASYGHLLHQNVPVELTALLFTDEMAALEAEVGSVDGEKVIPKNEWPHITIWTGEKIAAKEANRLPQLLLEGKATRIEINPPIIISGTIEFY